MLIGKNWKIESDNLNIILSRKETHHKRETGEEYEAWVDAGYYKTVANALHGLVEQEVKDTGLKDFKVVVAKVDELHQLIDSLKNYATEPRRKEKGEKVK